MSGVPGKPGEGTGAGTGRGRGRGRARTLQSTAQDAPAPTATAVTGAGSSTPSPSGPSTPRPLGASTQSGGGSTTSTGTSSDATRLSRDVKELSLSQKKALPLCRRPDAGGSAGRAIKLRANYFPIQVTSGQLTAYHYDVKVEHERRKLNREESFEVFWKVVAEHKTIFPQQFGIVYDGGSQVFSISELELPNGKLEKSHFDIEILLKRDDRPCKCSMDIKSINEYHLDLKKISSNEADHRMMPIQVMDVVYRASRSCPRIDSPFIPGGRSYYKPPVRARDPENDLGQGREIWSGYYCSAQITSGWKPMLNIDTSHTAFYKQIPMVEFMCEALSKSGGRNQGPPKWRPDRIDNRSQLQPMEQKMFQREIRDLMVCIVHRGEEGKRRAYRVQGVTAHGASQTTFKANVDGVESEMTVAQYFQQNYSPLRYPNLPCLMVGSKKRPIFMPLEVCETKFGQKCMKKLNEDMTSKMIKKACKDAPTREKLIQDMAIESKLSQDEFARKFGMSMESRMVELEGRMLEAPPLEYGRRKFLNPERGVWDLRGSQLLIGAEVGSWGLLSFLRQDMQGKLEQFSQALTRQANQMGLRMDEWPESVQYANRASDIEGLFKRIMSEVPENARGKKCGIIVVCLPARNTEIYAEVKRCGDVVFGVPTQVVLARNVQMPKPPTMSNIVLKVNVKCGGLNNKLGDDRLRIASRFLVDQPTLILGIDVTHPGPLDRHSPSIGAVVGNVDQVAGKFAASVKIQKHRKETVIYLTEAIKERLMEFYHRAGAKPTRIIIYRDGVAEGQFQQILQEELKCLREACKGLQEGYEPPMTFIVVQKRHHTRFFCRDQRDQCGKARNIPPGTTVDNTITHPEFFDFYLCSHFGIQGTSRPTHYYVLHDDSDLSSDDIQSITYHMCHMYFRCTRTVSIPAPAYYAHLVAQRAKFHLQHKIGGDFSDTGSVTSTEDEASTVTSLSDEDLFSCCRVNDELKASMYFA